MTITEAFCYSTGRPIELRELKGHMCIWRDNLYIMYRYSPNLTCGCKAKAIMGYKCNKHNDAKLLLCARKVMSMAPYPDKKSAQDENHATLIYDLGYCFDFFKALSVVDMALEHDDLEKKYQILSQLARPYETLAAENPQEDDTKTVSSPYFQSHAEKDACPLNEKIDTKLCAEQDEIVGNLVRPVEIIQGPPGTGKSTLIRSIARKQIPWRSDNITLILAVQNKATDVLVEGFAPFVDNQPQETRMLVMGSSTNPKMGPSAKHYTLDSLLPKNPEYIRALEGKIDNYASPLTHCPTNSCVVLECLFARVRVRLHLQTSRLLPKMPNLRNSNGSQRSLKKLNS